MTDRTPDISAALQEAQLQHFEASLAAKATKKPAKTAATTFAPGSTQDQESALRHLTGTPHPQSVAQAIKAMRLNADDFVL